MITKRTLVLGFLRSRRYLAFGLLLAGLLNGLVTLLLPLSLGRFYELEFGGGSNRSRLLDQLGLPGSGDWAAFFLFFGSLIGAKGLLEWGETYLAGYLSEQFAQPLREQLFARQLAAPLAIHRRKATGKYLLRYGSDLRSLRRYLTQGVVRFASDVLLVGLALGLLISLNAPLTGVLIGVLLPFLLVFRALNQRLETVSRARRDVRSANLAFVASRLANLATVKVFNRETLEIRRFATRSAKLSAQNLRYLRSQSVRQALLPVTVYVLVAALLTTVAYLDTAGGNLLPFVLLVLSLRPVLRRVLRVGTVWRNGHLSFASLTALLNQPTDRDAAANDFTFQRGELRFERVTFYHDPDRPLLTDLSFTARPGTLTRLIGPPGSGKSTVLELILKLHEPVGGTLWLDGQDLSTCSAQSVRQSVTLVGDAAPLLGQTVFEAITYRRSPDKRPRAARWLHRVQECVQPPYRLTLDDAIGPDGADLSAGQRRMLQWVRALLTGKPILLLDDPFAGLSTEAAERLGALLREQAPSRTVVLVSDRDIPGWAANQVVRLRTPESTFFIPSTPPIDEPA
jgi:ABC-type multidrug transport system fused ATPase/permease subunit